MCWKALFSCARYFNKPIVAIVLTVNLHACVINCMILCMSTRSSRSFDTVMTQ